MDALNFWLRMDSEYMWKWFCFDGNRTVVAHSAKSYFSYEQAKVALGAAKARAIQAAAN